MIGGTDTTSTMVEWTMTEMILHPEVMRKSQEELTTVVGINNTVEEFHIPKLEYLNAVIKETLTLHPAAPLLLPRCPTQSCNVGGYTIPKGTKVFLNDWTMHRYQNMEQKCEKQGSNHALTEAISSEAAELQNRVNS